MSAKLLKSVAASYDKNNLRTAREILAEPEGSGLGNWARAVVVRLGVLNQPQSATSKDSPATLQACTPQPTTTTTSKSSGSPLCGAPASAVSRPS